jgi:hypothetical protein
MLMIRGIHCCTTILGANLSPENQQVHRITFARSTHNASLNHHYRNHFPAE